jgi:lysophospholipase L1-like esterase
MQLLIPRLLVALAAALLACGCAASTGSTAPSGQGTRPTQPATAPPNRQTASPSPAEAASTNPSLRLVAIGDSIAGATLCRCPRYPEVYGTLAAEALGQPVRVENLAVVRLTSAGLLEAIGSSPTIESALRDADLITVTIGINDLRPCGTDMDPACYDSAIAGLKANLDAILGQIEALQEDHPHLLRVTGYYNSSIGNPELAQLGPSFQAFYAEQLAALNSTICAAVTAHHGLCVELLVAFNGPAGDRDAGALLYADHVHPSKTGNETIAHEIDAAGYAPLKP